VAKVSIHNAGTRVVASFLVLVTVVLLIEPHLMDVDPPSYVNVLLAPAPLLGAFVGRLLPHGNIGTAEHPIIERTPLDFVAGGMLVLFCLLLYPVVTYLLLSLVSRLLGNRS
jgi:hypothetical protein